MKNRKVEFSGSNQDHILQHLPVERLVRDRRTALAPLNDERSSRASAKYDALVYFRSAFQPGIVSEKLYLTVVRFGRGRPTA